MHTCAEDDIAFFVFKRSHQCEFDMIVLHEVQQSNKDQPAPDTEGEMADTTGGSEIDWFSNPNLQFTLCPHDRIRDFKACGRLCFCFLC